MAFNDQQPLLRNGNEESMYTRQESEDTSTSYAQYARLRVRTFLNSKAGHYSVLLLVSLDVSCIFADFIISLYRCEHRCLKEHAGTCNDLAVAQNALGVVSLVFSCLFMAELLASIWALGFGFFKSKFRCFDAVVIIVGFLIDVCLKGVLEEVGSIVIVLRLWRVIKIIEELSAGAEEQMDTLNEKIEKLNEENNALKRDIARLRSS